MNKPIFRIALASDVFVLAVGGLLFSIGKRAGFGGSAADPEAEYSKWKENGLPVSQTGIFDTSIPLKENAFPEMLKLRRDQFENERRLPKWASSFTSADNWESPEAQEILVDQRSYLDRLQAILQQASANRSLHNWEDGVAALSPELQHYKLWTRMLCADAERLIRQGEVKKAASRYVASFKLAEFIQADQTVLGCFSAMAQESITLRSIQHSASKDSDNSAVLESLRAVSDTPRWMPDPAAMMRMEGYALLATMCNVPKGNRMNSVSFADFVLQFKATPETTHNRLPENEQAKAMLAEVMRFFNTFYPRVKANPDDPALAGDTKAFIDSYRKRAASDQRVAAEFMATIGKRSTARRSVLADRRANHAYLAVLAFRQKNKRWPASLDEAGISGEKATDPFTGASLGYWNFANEMRIWHAGTDGKDNGGTTRPVAMAANKTEYDVVLFHPTKDRP